LSGTVADKKRLLRVTAGNLRQNHIYVTGHHDFFPDDCIGASSKSDDGDGRGVPIVITLDGLNKSVKTDIGSDPRTGKPRRHFRDRSWVREFFEQHEIQAGDLLAIERRGKRRYRLYPFSTATEHQHDWHEFLDTEPPGSGPTVLELFAGAGGMALGFKNAGFRTTLAVEWDGEACDTLRANITPRVAQCAIEEVDRFPKADVVAGGPPCQGFSNLGERVPFDPRRQLWRHFMRAVEGAQPRAFVMENVPPLLKSQEFVEIKRIAEKLGYQVDGRVLNAADYGAPQTRKRTIIIGVLDGPPTFPDPTHVDPKKKDLLSGELLPWRTVRDAIGDLPPAPTGENWHIGRNPTEMSLERYRCVPPGGNRWDLPLRLMPECWKRKTKGGTDLFGRLWWDRPSVTIRTEFYKPEKGRYLHPEEQRPITHREAARLQGFPDSFEFHGRRINVGIQIGNAVPVSLASALACHVQEIIDRASVDRSRTLRSG
jgi:DNA (cytosine-5)-methyltransferase 1